MRAKLNQKIIIQVRHDLRSTIATTNGATCRLGQASLRYAYFEVANAQARIQEL